MEADNGISSIIGAAENLGQLGLPDIARNLGDLRYRFAQSFLAFFVCREIEKKTSFLKTRPVFLPGVEEILERGLLSQNPLGLFSVVPEIRL